MNPKTIILTSKYVRKHGMSDNRWQLSDKQTQYRGILKLQVREEVIKGVDSKISKELEHREVTDLVLKNLDLRRKLDIERNGDVQMIRNILARNREIQLAYQNYPMDVVCSRINQSNFNKRKELDRLKVLKNDKVNRLTNLKLQLAEEEDEQKKKVDKIKVEIEMQTLHAKIEDVRVKIRMAVMVKNSYKSMEKLMEKDAIFYDKIIAALRQDGADQCKCIYRCIEMGQLATEYLDDRRNEFVDLEKQLRQEIKTAKADVAAIERKCKLSKENLGTIISGDFEKPFFRSYEPVDIKLANTLEDMDILMQCIKTMTISVDFQDILPTLQTSKSNNVKLNHLVKKLTRNRNILQHKLKSARVQYEILCNSTPDTTEMYKHRKMEVLNKIQSIKNYTQKLENDKLRISTKVANVSTSLQHIAKILERVKTESKKQEKRWLKIRAAKKDPLKYEDISCDPTKLIGTMEKAINILMKNMPSEELSEEDETVATKRYEDLVRISSLFLFQEKVVEEHSLLEIELEDAQVPTRAEIKRISARIVAEEIARAEREGRA